LGFLVVEVCGFGFRIWGLEFGVCILGFWNLGFGDWGSGFLGVEVCGLEFRIWGLVIRFWEFEVW
jgi:hypothetical protein